MSAEQAANHAFILSDRSWSAEVQMVGDLAPVLEHMLPGDVQGHGSHQWMTMQTLTSVLREDWALELLGSMIKYPFAVAVADALSSWQ